MRPLVTGGQDPGDVAGVGARLSSCPPLHLLHTCQFQYRTETDSGVHAQSGTLPRGPRRQAQTQKEVCVKLEILLGNSRTKSPVSYVKRQAEQSGCDMERCHDGG